MTVRRPHPRALAAFAVAWLLLPGCTLFDDYLPGTPFTPTQPVAEVTVDGGIQTSLITAPTGEGCVPGGTAFWGRARNTGDVDVVDVSITIEAFAGNESFLGSFSGSVFNGDVVDNPDGADSYGTDLEVDQSGSFTICTTIPFGAVARTEYLTHFVVIDEGD